jgi:hypothetical protein
MKPGNSFAEDWVRRAMDGQVPAPIHCYTLKYAAGDGSESSRIEHSQIMPVDNDAASTDNADLHPGSLCSIFYPRSSILYAHSLVLTGSYIRELALPARHHLPKQNQE